MEEPKQNGKKEWDAREQELDRFWDIDALLPPKRPVPKNPHTDTTEILLEPRNETSGTSAPARSVPIPPRGQSAKATEQKARAGDGEVIRSGAATAGDDSVIHRYIYPHTAEEEENKPKPEDEYTPESALIHSVRIFQWKSSYPYYEDFVKTAERLLKVRGKSCAHMSFFSYVPQYSQMIRPQLDWYLWLRECVRKGEAPDTDYSYVLLYVYEIINLADGMDVSEGQHLLCLLWLNYRDRYRQLDSYLPEWICDYSLIHHLPPPKELRGSALTAAMTHCALKEFYVGGRAEDGYLQALLAFCSNYDYRTSKFCTPENAELFEKTVLAVLARVTDHLSGSGKLFSASGMDDSRLTRDAYSGALCSYRRKRKIEVSYCSFSRSHELRFLVTDIVKYTENKIRACLGVRSKLTVYALPAAVRQEIDAYTAELLPAKKAVRKQAQKQEKESEYEKLYDLPAKPLSFADAAEIERLSWDTTQKLVDAFEEPAEADPEAQTGKNAPDPMADDAPPVPFHPAGGDTDPVPVAEGSPQIGDAPAPETAGEPSLSSVLAPYRGFLQAVLEENVSGQRAEAEKLGKLPDAAADEINELASELLGDILLEDDGLGYRVIEDYRSLL